MSKTRKGSPKLGSIPKSFKRLQNRSTKMKLKRNLRAVITCPEGNSVLRVPKSHAWNWF
jgi:hypothetical protein